MACCLHTSNALLWPLHNYKVCPFTALFAILYIVHAGMYVMKIPLDARFTNPLWWKTIKVGRLRLGGNLRRHWMKTARCTVHIHNNIIINLCVCVWKKVMVTLVDSRWDWSYYIHYWYAACGVCTLVSFSLLLPCVHAQGPFVHLSSLSTDSLRFSSARVWWMVQNSIHILEFKLWLIEGLSYYVYMGKLCICHFFCPRAIWWAGPCTHIIYLTTFTWRVQNWNIECLRVWEKVKNGYYIAHENSLTMPTFGRLCTTTPTKYWSKVW